jgi:hypothetical protein
MGDPITPPRPEPDPAQPEPLPMPDDYPFPAPPQPPSKEPLPDSPKIGDTTEDVQRPPKVQRAASTRRWRIE